jgi:hypothetical protein
MGQESSLRPEQYRVLNRIIYVVGDITYICEAAPGVESDESRWRISKIEESGGTTTTTWASGTSKFRHVADDYASYDYS